MTVFINERVYLHVDRFLEHSPSPFSHEFVERLLILELPSEGEYLGIQLLVYWRRRLVCLNLLHGVMPALGC